MQKISAAALLAPVFSLLTGCASTSEAPTPKSSPVASTTLSAPESDRVYDISQLDQPPRPAFQARPHYPLALREANLSGEAVVDFVVDTQGNVVNPYVLRSTRQEFGTAAVEAVSKWKFKPGRKGGRDVSTHMQVPIVFTLNSK